MAFLSKLQNEPPKVADYAKNLRDPIDAIYWKMTAEFGAMYVQMFLDWVNKCKEELEEIKNGNQEIQNTADNPDRF